MAPQPSVTVVGRPFDPMGMGEFLRSVIRSFRAVGVNVGVRDVYGFRNPDPLIVKEFSGQITEEFDSDVNIFCINGDEVDPVLRRLGNLPTEAHNIVYPTWELSKYPATWAEQLSRFDEIWTTSQFTHDSIKAAVAKPVIHIPLSGELLFSRFMGRRYFGISESAFVFLFFVDFKSYIQRKNPFAVLRSFEELCSRLPNDDMQLVIKSKSGETRPDDYDLFRRSLSRYADRVVLIHDVLSDSEIKNLLRCSDAFVSLHRSEGFGLGLISAMFLGKPVVATGYSGNQDYMKEDNSCLVCYELCNVPDGAYPFSEGQVWAEPDVPHAVDQMARLVSDRDYARQIGDKASRHIRVNFSHRAIGLRYLDRVRRVGLIQDGLS
jgi:glycosyltransferase involved in cell wall biosynthesis